MAETLGRTFRTISSRANAVLTVAERVYHLCATSCRHEVGGIHPDQCLDVVSARHHISNVVDRAVAQHQAALECWTDSGRSPART